MFCTNCGKENEPGSAFCTNCGYKFNKEADNYALYWKRLVALIIDLVIVFIPSIILSAVGFALTIGTGSIFGGLNDSNSSSSAATGIFLITFLLINILIALIFWLYFAVMESSSKQATVGKLIFGIKVTDINGNRISFGKSTLRFLIKLPYTVFGRIPGLNLILMIPLFLLAIANAIMPVTTSKKQALHDMAVGTVVVNK